MISGFQSREYGLGVGVLRTLEIIELITIKRSGSKYRATEDIMLLFSTDLKSDLTDNPTL